MHQNETSIKTTFRHVVLRGTAYSIGVAQAEQIQGIPGWKQFFESGRAIPQRASLDETVQLMRRYNPAAEEEITGFCDTLKIAAADLIYYASTHLKARHCSHLVALPAVTANGHTLMGRNYDFGDSMDDMRLCSTTITGKYAHIGFSSMFFGRQEGINEHGLAVTASVGGMPVGIMAGLTPPLESGLQFWAQVRAILEECKTVSEAQALFMEIPNCSNPIFLIADASGAAVIAEGYGRHKLVRPVENGWAVATNHFTSDEMRPFHPQVMTHSVVRAQTASNYLKTAQGQIDSNGIKQLLATPYPHGLACHYYKEYFGTLHSMLFDLNERSVQVTFGSPAVNPWHTFRFGEGDQAQYESTLPLEHSDPQFWTMA
jgi:predicted choloylglycine hydrolase